MTNQVNKEIILPEGGPKENSLYLVEVSYSRHNPVHQAYLRVGFLNESYRQGDDIRRMFGGYCYLWNGSYDNGYASVRDIHYMKVIKLLHTDGEQVEAL